jgi:uncharacterized protein (TIGR02271 family)
MENTMQNVRLDELRGAPVFDRSGDKIGNVEEIFYDHGTSKAEWIGIGTGFFGTKRVLVPVQGASSYEDGISVPYDKDQVKDSPDIDSDDISGQTEQELYSYYGLGGVPTGYADTTDTTDTTARSTGDSVTRSEEELQVGTRQTDAGSVRLRKWVETEPVALDVELQRETARVVREDINEPIGRDADAFSEEQVEVPLREEQAVTAKQTVAKERVGIQKDVETRTETVQDEVRKERVEVEGDGNVDR